MKNILYATSLQYPSRFANRKQVLHQSFALYKKMREGFILGVTNVSFTETDSFFKDIPIIQFFETKSIFLAWKMISFCNKEKIQRIYTREANLLLMMYIYAKFFFRIRINFFYEIHYAHDENIKTKTIEFFVARIAKYIFSITENLKTIYVKKYKISSEKIFVAPDGFASEIFDKNIDTKNAREIIKIDQSKKYITYAGRFSTLNEEKGVEDIINAIEILPSNIVGLIIGGDVLELSSRIIDKAKKMTLEGRLIFPGYLDQSQLAVYLKASDILLMPFPDTEHYRYYMSPLKMFEYMACNKPIITTDLPSIREILSEKNSYFIENSSPKKIAEKIKEVLRDSASSEKAAIAYSDAQKYTWDKRAELLISHFNI